MQNLILKTKFVIALTVGIVFLAGCVREEEEPPKSMEQIHEVNGVPVKVTEIKRENMSAGLEYFAKIRGWKETTEGVALPEEIVKINAKIGDWVNKGDVIIEYPNDAPTLQFKQAQIQLETVSLTYQRAKNLLDIGEMSQQKFDEIEMQYKLAKRGVESLEAMLKVESPISGYIVSMPVEAGDIPKIGSPLFTVAKLNKMIANINVSDSEISQVKKGMKADGYWQGHKFSGRVTDVSIAVNPKTQSFPVEITFNNPKKELRPGITLDIVLNTMKKDSVIAIPESAIVEKNGKSNVYVASAGQAVLREVETGVSAGTHIEILSGLSEGDRLINCCFNMLKNGKKINIVD